MLKQIIQSLEYKIEFIKIDLINKPMSNGERLEKVVALDKINDAINLLQSIDL